MRDLDWIFRSRPFAYSTVYAHPDIGRRAAFLPGNALARPDLPREVAEVCKNESNCTVCFADGMWLTTWSQGSAEGTPDEFIVFATSRDQGRTWSAPQRIIGWRPELQERIAYGIPFLVPETERLYLFFFIDHRILPGQQPVVPERNGLHFIHSDDRGITWSEPRKVPVELPEFSFVPGHAHFWVNHSPVLLPSGDVVFTVSLSIHGTYWQLGTAEVRTIHCLNILTETDPAKLRFHVYPEGETGIRVDAAKHADNPALARLIQFFDPNQSALDIAWNLQELTIVPLSQTDTWLGVGRCYLGSVAYTVTHDRGRTWSSADPLRYAPAGPPIAHPMTMCPIARFADGRFILFFTNNDGSARGAAHVWDGDGHTRNPQWFAIGREIPGETRNGGLVFGEPRILADVDDTGDVNLKTGISMPQYFGADGRHFVCYNANKEHLFLDEIPAAVIDDMTPAV
jgi:hypothetical protein